VSGAGPQAIPLADAPSLVDRIRRTRLARLALAALVVALAVVAFLAAMGRHAETVPYLPHDSTGIVVLDVSASISSDTYARIASTLDRLERSGGRYGLVLFSDTAYQALPPGTPARELQPFERFFRVPEQTVPGVQPRPPRSPWSESFGAGTRISTGLRLALDVIRDQRLRRPSVLLVSDLDDDAEDLESLTAVALAYRELGIPIRVVGLNPAPEDRRYLERLLRTPGDLTQATLPGEGTTAARADLPVGLALATGALAVALAAFLVATERLRWRAPA
jgi:hypothetical protein